MFDMRQVTFAACGRLFLVFGALVSLLLGGAWFALQSVPALGASIQDVEQTTDTSSYRIKVKIGPKVTMAMTTMTTVDHGQSVNRHLEVHIFDKKSGAEVKAVVPVVRITDQATGTSRGLPNVKACLMSRHRETEPHFGDNLYLRNGTYTVAVSVGKEIATFRNLAVKGTGAPGM
ncbi:MAG: hypothetical protein ACRDGM_12095 [bacterium]